MVLLRVIKFRLQPVLSTVFKEWCNTNGVNLVWPHNQERPSLLMLTLPPKVPTWIRQAFRRMMDILPRVLGEHIFTIELPQTWPITFLLAVLPYKEFCKALHSESATRSDHFWRVRKMLGLWTDYLNKSYYILRLLRSSLTLIYCDCNLQTLETDNVHKYLT